MVSEREWQVNELLRHMRRKGYVRERRSSVSGVIGKAMGKLIATAVSGALIWCFWGDDISEKFPIISEACDKIGLSFCSSAEAMQEDEVLIEDETVEI